MTWNRNRSIQIPLRVTEEELQQIEERMRESGVINREAYLRKMAIDGYILKIDLSGINEMISLLRRTSNNVNQIAHKLNASGKIYDMDLRSIQKNQEQLWNSAEKILNQLSKLT